MPHVTHMIHLARTIRIHAFHANAIHMCTIRIIPKSLYVFLPSVCHAYIKNGSISNGPFVWEISKQHFRGVSM